MNDPIVILEERGVHLRLVGRAAGWPSMRMRRGTQVGGDVCPGDQDVSWAYTFIRTSSKPWLAYVSMSDLARYVGREVHQGQPIGLEAIIKYGVPSSYLK